MVYNDTISYSKAKKHHIYNLSEKVLSSGGANNIRAYFPSDYDAIADSNEIKLTIAMSIWL